MEKEIGVEAIGIALAALIKALHNKGVVSVNEVTQEMTAAVYVIGSTGKEQQAMQVATYISKLKGLCPE